MRILLFSVFVLGRLTTISQSTDKLQVTLLKAQPKGDSCCVYNITIKNLSDSVACILHSMFMNLKSTMPHGLPLHFQRNSPRFYSLSYSFRDTTFQLESTPYRGECIFPYQSLQFEVIIVPGNEMGKQLRFEYLYVPDFCYNAFMKNMQQMTTWYLKYKRKEKIIELPE
jgi:hypothetical protein